MDTSLMKRKRPQLNERRREFIGHSALAAATTTTPPYRNDGSISRSGASRIDDASSKVANTRNTPNNCDNHEDRRPITLATTMTRMNPTVVPGSLSTALQALNQASAAAGAAAASISATCSSSSTASSPPPPEHRSSSSSPSRKLLPVEESGYTADGDDTTAASSLSLSANNHGYTSSSSSAPSSAFSSPRYFPSSPLLLGSEMEEEEESDDSRDKDRTPFSMTTITTTQPCFSSPRLSHNTTRSSKTNLDGNQKRAAALPSSASFIQATIKDRSNSNTSDGSAPPHVLELGSDVMAHVLGFMDPPEALEVLTLPLCKQWRHSYTASQDLWRTLCRSEPFGAKLNDDAKAAAAAAKGEFESAFDSDDDDSFCSLNGKNDSDDSDDDDEDDSASQDVLGEYRLMYTSFVRCMNYLKRIQDDVKKGRPLTGTTVTAGSTGYGAKSSFPTFGVTKGLKKFLARSKNHGELKTAIGNGSAHRKPVSFVPIGVSADGQEIPHLPTGAASKDSADQSNKPKFGNSMITARLLGPTASGAPSHLNLPTTCAIYSIVNWMVAHPDVEGIQTICVSSLPVLLEDEQQRLTAQRVGLIEVVLGAMMRFPKCLKLHIAAFHTLVLLARPIGGREGMLFDNSMANTTRGLGLTSNSGRFASSGMIDRPPDRLNSMGSMSVLMESMRRFQKDENLQAMACWAMVNLALVPAQKTALLSLDGIQAAISALTNHPKSFEVQFRALFALINLVVPCKDPVPLTTGNERTEQDVLDDCAPEVSRLVVVAMENFCGSERILNRATLVLHNLSQTQAYLSTLLWTPHLYQMLEWCITNHPTDPILRRSASSTLNRIQVFLSQNILERQRFLQSMARQQEAQQEQQPRRPEGAPPHQQR